MTRIVSAINAMIRNSIKIKNVCLRKGGELFFEYDEKHKWSIHKREDDTLLWFYPGSFSIDYLANVDGDEWENVQMVTYRLSDIGTREARESFNELYTLLKEKAFGIDDILDEIIEDGADDIPF